MNLRALRTLARIREVGSFARAAEDLNQTLSAVSMQMKGLEEALDVELFDRAFRPPKLTPVGRAIAERAAVIVREQELLAGLAQPAAALRGHFHVGFVLTASVRLLPGFLARSAGEAPDARFDVEIGLSEHLCDAVLRGRLDAAVVTRSDALPRELGVRDLLEEEIVFALPATVAGLGPEAIARRLPFLQFMPHNGIGRLIAGRLESSAFPPGRIITMDGIEAIVECARRGIGYTALPRSDIRRYAGRELVLHRFGEEPLMRTLSLVTLRDGPTDRAGERLVELLSAEEGRDDQDAIAD